jgi:hypothetical protein
MTNFNSIGLSHFRDTTSEEVSVHLGGGSGEVRKSYSNPNKTGLSHFRENPRGFQGVLTPGVKEKVRKSCQKLDIEKLIRHLKFEIGN